MPDTTPATAFGFLSHALWAMGAVALYAAVQHLALGLLGSERRLHLSFSALALAVAVNLPAAACAYQAGGIPELVLANKVMHTSAGVFLLSLLWFLPAYARHEPRGFKILLAPPILILLTLTWLRPEGLLFDRIDRIVPGSTPWGEFLAVAHGRYSVWSRLYVFPALTILGVGIHLALSLKRSGWQERGRWLGLALGLLATGVVWTALLDFKGQRDALRGVEIGFMAIVVLMNGQLVVEAAETQRMRTLLRRMAAETNLAGVQERRRLATALHDSPLQQLALARMQIQRQTGIRQLEQPLALLEQEMEELRDAIFELSPALL